MSDEQTEIFRSSKLLGTMAEKLRIAALTKEEREMAQYADMNHWDRCAVEDAARESGIEIGIPKGIEIGIPKGKELGRLEADVENYQNMTEAGMTDEQICRVLKWDSAKLNTIKRAVTSPKLKLNQENQSDRTVE